MYEPSGTHVISLTSDEIAAATKPVLRVTASIHIPPEQVEFINGYRSDARQRDAFTFSEGQKRAVFTVWISPLRHEYRPEGQRDISLTIRSWQDKQGHWRLADNTNRKICNHLRAENAYLTELRNQLLAELQEVASV